ncbi:MAG TPA: CBS domain-containing protein [Polyangiaceae bacterium]|nr:CBS domain-containing protein [Polyangiaceae bacterium]
MDSVLLRLARRPPVTIRRDATVLEAVRVMLENQVGAALVLEDGRAVGVFTERDIMGKVVADRLDPETTKVATVMTSPVHTIPAEAEPAAALELMLDKHIRHLPLVDVQRRVVGILSMRYLMRHQIDRLQDRARSLENYLGSEGHPGG